MNDGAMYTGVDAEPTGIFENEIRDEKVKEKIKEQERLVKELTPKLQDLIAMIDLEIASVNDIDQYINATDSTEDNIRAELRAAALYKKKLENLKTKFALALGEVTK
jgi:septal ring factor EnvC (AmiA/AmiB activator)